MANANIELKNLKGVYYVGPDGGVVSDNTAAIQPGSIGIIVNPSEDGPDAVDITFPDVQVEAYSKKKNTGAMSGTVQALLRSLWIEQIDNMEYDEGEDKLCINCTLAADEGDVDNSKVDEVVSKYRECRNEHNALCKPADSDDDSDSDPPATSGGDDSNPPKDKPQKQPQKRQPREANESATGAKLEHITQSQADRDTHATLVAIGGEEFAKHFNGLVWDEGSETYKDET